MRVVAAPEMVRGSAVIVSTATARRFCGHRKPGMRRDATARGNRRPATAMGGRRTRPVALRERWTWSHMLHCDIPASSVSRWVIDPPCHPIKDTLMNTDTMMQPFVKLTQSNTELLSRYATSPEVTTQTAHVVEGLIQQMQDATLKLSNSKAFGNLAQGLMNNYMQFWSELSQSLAAGFSQGQFSLMRQAEAVTSEAIDATQANLRRARQAA